MMTVPLQAAGSGESGPESKEKPLLFAANYPLYYICRLYAGDYIDLLWPFDDEDPAFWEPDDSGIREVQKADLLILNGAGYDKWMEYSFIDQNRSVDSSAAFKTEYIENPGGSSHSHGEGSVHDHGSMAFTVWLDLSQYALQAESVYEALVKLLPERKKEIEERHREFLSELEGLDHSFRELGSAFGSETVLASHPVYQYFSRAYGVSIKSLLLEPELYPGEDDWKALASLQEEFGSSLMIWEGVPLPETRRTLEEMGISWVVISPGFNRSSGKDYPDILKENLSEFERLGTMRQ